jgi:hypothetical protein
MSRVLQIIQILTHILLTIVIIVFIITGFGITNYQSVGSLTGGIFSKPTSFLLHSNLIIPFIILLILHMMFTLLKIVRKKQGP